MREPRRAAARAGRRPRPATTATGPARRPVIALGPGPLPGDSRPTPPARRGRPGAIRGRATGARLAPHGHRGGAARGPGARAARVALAQGGAPCPVGETCLPAAGMSAAAATGAAALLALTFGRRPAGSFACAATPRSAAAGRAPAASRRRGRGAHWPSGARATTPRRVAGRLTPGRRRTGRRRLVHHRRRGGVTHGRSTQSSSRRRSMATAPTCSPSSPRRTGCAAGSTARDQRRRPAAGCASSCARRSPSGTVLAVDAPQHLSIAWDWEGEPLGCPSVVAFDLIDHGARTHLTLRHIGFPGSRQHGAAHGALALLVRAPRRRRARAAGGDARLRGPAPCRLGRGVRRGDRTPPTVSGPAGGSRRHLSVARRPRAAGRPSSGPDHEPHREPGYHSSSWSPRRAHDRCRHRRVPYGSPWRASGGHRHGGPGIRIHQPHIRSGWTPATCLSRPGSPVARDRRLQLRPDPVRAARRARAPRRRRPSPGPRSGPPGCPRSARSTSASRPAPRLVSCVGCQVVSATRWATSGLKRDDDPHQRLVGDHVPGAQQLARERRARVRLERLGRQRRVQDALHLERAAALRAPRRRR